MSEYTVTYPIHIGQQVWVKESLVLPYGLAHENAYIVGTIVSFTISKVGEHARKDMKILLDDKRVPHRNHLFKITVNAIGNTVFAEKPAEDVA